jgi:hypothetical protein
MLIVDSKKANGFGAKLDDDDDHRGWALCSRSRTVASLYQYEAWMIDCVRFVSISCPSSS